MRLHWIRRYFTIRGRRDETDDRCDGYRVDPRVIPLFDARVMGVLATHIVNASFGPSRGFCAQLMTRHLTRHERVIRVRRPA